MASGNWPGIEDEIQAALSNPNFKSLSEAQEAIDEITSRYNNRVIAEFQGLTPGQMQALLYHPFDCPEIVEFPDSLSTEPTDALVIRLLLMLIDAAGEKGIKLTQAGYLPRSLVRQIVESILSPASIDEMGGIESIRYEANCVVVHQVRITSLLAHVLQKRAGRLVVPKTTRKLLETKGTAAVYPRMLRAFATQLNWAYLGYFGDVPIVQLSFAFSLSLLNKFGEDWRPAVFYEDAILLAFPRSVEIAFATQWNSAEQRVRQAYRGQFLDHFAPLFGLAQCRGEHNSLQIRATPLLADVARFRGNATPDGYRGNG